MAYGDFGADVRAGRRMIGTFVKTPDGMVVETLARTGLDFSLPRRRTRAFRPRTARRLSRVGRALGFPCLVRVPAAAAEIHSAGSRRGCRGVSSFPMSTAPRRRPRRAGSRVSATAGGDLPARRAARTGAGAEMAGVLARGADPVILVQIEEPEGVDDADAIAAAPGIDGVFLGPADLSVGYGHDSLGSDDLAAAYSRVGKAVVEPGGPTRHSPRMSRPGPRSRRTV